MNRDSKIFIAGHNGLVGSALVRQLNGYSNLILKTRKDLNLLDGVSVKKFFEKERPEFVFMAAAKVGGILANDTYPAEFIFENLQVQNNIIHNSYLYEVKKLLFLGSSCIYPRLSPQPIEENCLLSGPLEKTNEWYAVAKIAGIKMCQAYRKQYECDFISVMPTNLYGINDNYDLDNSHVLPGLIRKFHIAKKNNKNITCFGSGSAYREFLFSDDLAKALILLMEKYSDSEIINVGSGIEISIKNLASKIGKIIGFDGEIEWDLSKPDGTPRKIVDSSKIKKLGWNSEVDLESGIRISYNDYLSRYLNE